jgi:hypothetical protein
MLEYVFKGCSLFKEQVISLLLALLFTSTSLLTLQTDAQSSHVLPVHSALISLFYELLDLGMKGMSVNG